MQKTPKSIKKQTAPRYRKMNRQQAILQLIIAMVILVCVNIIGHYFFTRLDLTSEKRYTLSDSTKKILKNLNDIISVEVYLEGDFPSDYKRLRNATREILDEMRAYHSDLEYVFINPSESPNPEERHNTYDALTKRGLLSTTIQHQTKDGITQQIIFPGAFISYKGRIIAIQLLQEQIGIKNSYETINNSIQNLEYAIISAINKMSRLSKPRVAFINGHGELSGRFVADIKRTLSQDYILEDVEIAGQINALTNREAKDSTGELGYRYRNRYNAIVVAQPLKAFDEKDKFIIDQFIMHGGRVLWLIDPVLVSMDSLQMANSTFAVPLHLNLDDQLFGYGVRLNTDLVMDINCLPIAMVTGYTGNTPQMSLVPWLYFPLVTPNTNYPVVRNLNALKTQFVSTIDTVYAPGVKKTILLASSAYSRTVRTPALVDLNIAKQRPIPQLFTQKYLPISVLLEGTFASLYANRMAPELQESALIGFKESSKETAMIVVADGDIIRNQLDRTQGYPLPLGYDFDTKNFYGNKDFILNVISYLADDDGLISIRSREIKIRLLDKTRIDSHELFWQIINVVLPIVLIALFGIGWAIARKKRYAK